MKKNSFLIHAVLATIVAALIGCGGGGGGGGAAAPATKAIVTLSATGTLPAGTQIGGITVTLNLPAGVTAKASPYSAGSSTAMVTDAGVVAASGAAAGSYAGGGYVSGTAASTYKIVLGVAGANGFSAGEFAKVSCDIASGSSPAAAEFSLSNFVAKDVNGAALAGLTPGFTVAFQ